MKVLFLMKGSPAIFCFYYYIFIPIYLSVKQNLSHTWFLRPHTLGKLTLSNIRLIVKQILGHV